MLPPRYVHSRTPNSTPAIEHGYVLTAHLAHGMTVDRACARLTHGRDHNPWLLENRNLGHAARNTASFGDRISSIALDGSANPQ